MAEPDLSEVPADALETLFTLDPSEFTKHRNALAKRLRHDGDRTAADVVQHLSRPPLAIWALNQVVRSRRDVVEEFLEAAQELREAQLEGGDLRAKTPPERAAQALVVEAVREQIDQLGGHMTDTVMRRLRQTLRAAASDPDAADRLRSGRLTRELEPPAVGDLLSQMRPRPKRARQAAQRRRSAAEELAQARKELGAARTEMAAKRLAAREAAATETAARQRWEEAAREAEAAAAELAEVETTVHDLQERVAQLRKSR